MKAQLTIDFSRDFNFYSCNKEAANNTEYGLIFIECFARLNRGNLPDYLGRAHILYRSGMREFILSGRTKGVLGEEEYTLEVAAKTSFLLPIEKIIHFHCENSFDHSIKALFSQNSDLYSYLYGFKLLNEDERTVTIEVDLPENEEENKNVTNES